MNELPHLDDHGRSRMIDIGGKAITRRTAIATGRLDTTPAVLELLAANQLSASTLTTIRTAVESIPTTANNAAINRVYTAILLTLAAPEFITQK